MDNDVHFVKEMYIFVQKLFIVCLIMLLQAKSQMVFAIPSNFLKDVWK